MIKFMLPNYHPDMEEVTDRSEMDAPLYLYIKDALKEIEIINMIGRWRFNTVEDRYKGIESWPEIHITDFKWNPHPKSEELVFKRRETSDKIATKSIYDLRLGILSFNMVLKARNNNKIVETSIIPNSVYVPIEDEHGRFIIKGVRYMDTQMVDKLRYPLGKNTDVFKSLMPILMKYSQSTETSIDGYVSTGRSATVRIFNSDVNVMTCFMHLANPFMFLELFPMISFTGYIADDKNLWEYFKPLEDRDIYIKCYRPGLDEFHYLRSILNMTMEVVRKYKPLDVSDAVNPEWWIYILSYNEDMIEHKGAAHQMHIGRMLDTITSRVLPIPINDRLTIFTFLRFTLQTELKDVDIMSLESKRFRRNEMISTIVTSLISEKLKMIFRYGVSITMSDLESLCRFQPTMITKQLYKIGTMHPTDFVNDNDYPNRQKWTKRGPNSLGRQDENKIKLYQRQSHPSYIGNIDLYDCPKDVGQSGMFSPWMKRNSFEEKYEEYNSVKFDLYKFIEKHFPGYDRIDVNSIEELNEVLDRLVTCVNFDTIIDIDRIQELIDIKKGKVPDLQTGSDSPTITPGEIESDE